MVTDKKKEIELLLRKLEEGVKACINSDEFKKLLTTFSRFPKYSVNNLILIYCQNPAAELCNSYTGWQKMGRQVKKGAVGLRIFAPAPYKIKEEVEREEDGLTVIEEIETSHMAFKPVSTFDISQTEGDPLPSYEVKELTGDVSMYRTMWDAIVGVTPCPVKFEDITNGAKGYYHIADNYIAVNNGMSEVQNIKTLLHECTHQLLHNAAALKERKVTKEGKETEAEAVAFIVSSHFGIDTSDYSFKYLAGWSTDKEVSDLKASLDIIKKTSLFFIEEIEKKLQEGE